MLDAIADLLKIPGDFFGNLIHAVPLPMAKGIFILYPIILILWVFTFKKEEVQGKLHLCGDRTIDIRFFAIATLIGQIIIYSIF